MEPTKPKTLQEVKDTYAKEKGFHDWLGLSAQMQLWSDIEDHLCKAAELYAQEREKALGTRERFIKPTDSQVVSAAILFNDGKIHKKKLTDMVALVDFVIDRLHENGDITIPTKSEQFNEK